MKYRIFERQSPRDLSKIIYTVQLKVISPLESGDFHWKSISNHRTVRDAVDYVDELKKEGRYGKLELEQD